MKQRKKILIWIGIILFVVAGAYCFFLPQILGSISSAEPTSPGIEIAANKTLLGKTSTLIDSLYAVDQKVQQNISKASQNGEKEKVNQLISEEMEIFKRHIPILKDIYNEIGYPSIELVGEESSAKFLILVQHSDADIEFQKEMLKEISKELEKGNVQARDFAFLTDRVQLAQEKPQVYGTQISYNTDLAQAFPLNLLDSINVNQRRTEIGLEPLEEYLNAASQGHFYMNQAYYVELGIYEPKLY